MLYWRCVELFADLRKQFAAGVPVCFSCPHLDQFVRIKTGFQFAIYGRGQAFLADDDDWIERVRARAKGALLGRCEIEQMILRGGL